MSSSQGHGERFLSALGFLMSGDWLVLSRQGEDKALLWLGKTCLEKVQTEITYLRARDRIEMEKVLEVSTASADEEETARRKKFDAKVVPEPKEGSAGTTRVSVMCGNVALRRRFCADDSIESIVCWLGATHSSLIPIKLDEASWMLYDTTLYPERPIDYAKLKHSTLQAANLWPSCELELRACEPKTG